MRMRVSIFTPKAFSMRSAILPEGYNTKVAAKTVHVFPSDGTWVVKREGKSGKIFVTQREAVQAARKSVKTEKAGQFVVHGTDGKIEEHGAYRMTAVQDPPKKSRRAIDIERAVGKISLRHIQADAIRDRSPKK